ncbi:MAG TPA: type 1 glutamine amidotransferase domain-containing protein [Acidimicrobiales bacterium]|nr:type 1 glutamine amidotransferase domain-containing protein [Acidimicrobiales bacterium]
MAGVLIPIPERDFDPTEVAVSWKVLSELGHQVRFATPAGTAARADDLMVTGRGLDPWGFMPGLSHLVGVGRILRADARGRAAYAELLRSPAFSSPIAWADIDGDFDGLVLPGGHRARGMREYLESPVLQAVVVRAFRAGKPIAAICHGVLLAARSVDPATGHSVLYGRKTTALTWTLEHRAARVARISRFWDAGYYRTYLEEPGQPAGYMSVQHEVTRALAVPEDFLDVVPGTADARLKSGGRARDTIDDERPAFVVDDGHYLSARWPGDVHTFAKRFASML